MDSEKIDQVRSANFPAARRGYDKHAVDNFLSQVAGWLEDAQALGGEATGDVKRELAKVGERTAGILTAAEEAAASVRTEATERAATLKRDAEEAARRARLEASQTVDALTTEADSKAEQIIDEAIARRRKLDEGIQALLHRRDEIAEEVTRLSDELRTAVEALSASDRAPAVEEEPAIEMQLEDVEPDPGEQDRPEPDAEAGEDEDGRLPPVPQMRPEGATGRFRSREESGETLADEFETRIQGRSD